MMIFSKTKRVVSGIATLAICVVVAGSLVTTSTAKSLPANKADSTHPHSVSNRLVHICNHSNGGVNVALAQDYQGDFATKGWWTIQNTACLNLSARYLRVERVGNENYTWYISADRRTMCIVNPGPFTIFTPDSASACRSAGGQMANYAPVPDGSGTYNWTLLP